ncbi:SusC/RagA family TonB-linked outer membrane protein [Flagellimonas nanhaiensis]|uniref:SusC/RagA family TonB-linked outer membrane protein n=1 Tax=Flagellimonas nanhaiensis TaxID=2292706 RepID=A0A371JPD2_9FLAO|nr:SusC/RagA family TonB-linked outer membrane protein [Allomuricauda nanhaiensis]RDY59369.1 SusC/RagA family TonB-linked outer membrane protein [Allomuricauda nanhaiensis]
MKAKNYWIAFVLLLCVFTSALAQEKNVSGNVTDENGLPLPGVSVIVVGTSNGTQTDFDGNYNITASVGQILRFSYIGQKTEERTVGSSSIINLSMQEDAQALEEVVVTAQGVKREKKALGYAVTTLKGEDISERPETDVARALSGQVAGVNILGGSGLAGSGANITIRGFSTMTGSNQPLIIVDGVPFSNDTNETSTFSTSESGNNSASRLLDLDPNNISSLSVLKGLSATVLYGEQGRNGVILITTKAGSGSLSQSKLEVSVSSSYFVEKISSTPDYQNRYGNGWQQSLGKAFSNWGAELDGQQILHPYSGNAYNSVQQGGGSFDQSFPQFAGNTSYEYKAYNSVDRFFRPGYTAINNINVSKSSEVGRFNLSYSNSEQKGFTPNNTLRRNNFSVGGTVKLSNNFTFNGTMSYANTAKRNPPNAASTGSSNVSSGGSGVFANVMYTPRSVDLMGLPFEDDLHRSVYYRSNNSIQNPRWTAENEIDQEVSDRSFFSMSGTYNFNDKLSATWRTGFDGYNETAAFKVNKGGIYLPNGLYYESRYTGKIWDHSVILNYNNDFSDKVNLSLTAGANARRNTFTSSSVRYDKQLIYGSFFADNFEDRVGTSLYREQENVYGAYLSATLGINSFVYLNVAGRNDWSSTHESGNNSIAYPSASISFIPTSAFEGLQSKNGLNYLKLRLGYGSSANFANPYVTKDRLGVAAKAWLDSNGNPVNINGSPINIADSGSNRLGNSNLKPELVSEIELGMDLKAFNNRFGLEASVYTKEATDQILDKRLDPSSGYTVTAVNAGKLETKGFEAGFNITPILSDNFRWNFIANFDAYESTVAELPGGEEDQLFLSGPFSNLGNFAIQGQPFNVMMGNKIQRDNDGNPIVGADGLYLEEDQIGILGDPNPDWQGTLINTLSYKNFTFGMQWNYQHGGDMYSATAATLTIRGLAGETDFDRSIPVVAPGVKQDGTTNDIQITANDHYWENLGISEFRIWDATHLRLREVSLSYSLSKKALDKTPFGDITITAIGNNLWFKAFNFPDSINFDPAVSSEGVGNSRGFDLLTGPTAKRYGLTVRASF